MTREEALKLTDQEINEKIDKLSKKLDMGIDWDTNYTEYRLLYNILNERYRESNIVKFEEFFFKNINGKEWEEVQGETWDFYSDWHKDMFGYRPRSTDKDW